MGKYFKSRSRRTVGTSSSRSDGTVTSTSNPKYTTASRSSSSSSYSNVSRLTSSDDKGSTSYDNITAERNRLLASNSNLTTSQQKEIKTSNIQTVTPVSNSTNQTVGVAVSGQDLANFRQGFNSQGYSTAGQLLSGMREGKVKKKGDTYVIENNVTSEKKVNDNESYYGWTDNLTEKGREQVLKTKQAYAGHPDVSTKPKTKKKWSFLPVKDKRNTLSEQEYNKQEMDKRLKFEKSLTPSKAFSMVSSPVMAGAYGVGAGVSTVSEPIIWSLTNKERPVYSTDEAGNINSKMLKHQHQEQAGQIGLGMIGAGLTSVKPLGRTRLNWHEQDIAVFEKATPKDTTYHFRKTKSYDLFGKRKGGFEPYSNEFHSQVKSKQLQSQLYPKEVEPINLLKRENPIIKRLKGIDGAKQNPNQVKFPKAEARDTTLFEVEELTSTNRYKNLLEVAKQEAKANSKPSTYQRGLVEFENPHTPTPTPKVKVETVSRIKKPRILIDKRGSTGATFKSLDKVYEKSGRFAGFDLGGVKKAKLNKGFNAMTGEYEYVITPNTQLPYWEGIGSNNVIVEERKSTYEVKGTSKSSVITYAKVIPSTKSELQSRESLMLKQDVMARLKTSQKSKTQLELNLKAVQSLGMVQVASQTQALDLATVQIQDTMLTSPKQTYRTPPKQVKHSNNWGEPTPTGKPWTPPTIKGLDIPLFSKSSNNNFNLSVRKRGKFKTVARNLDLKSAYKLAKKRVGNTASASFKLTPLSSASERKLSLFKPNKDFYKSKTEEFTFIEKRGRRIKSGGELREITFKGIASQKKKKKKGLWSF